eukprot:6205018-Pleurochrysis_carterae.AAC.2
MKLPRSFHAASTRLRAPPLPGPRFARGQFCLQPRLSAAAISASASALIHRSRRLSSLAAAAPQLRRCPAAQHFGRESLALALGEGPRRPLRRRSAPDDAQLGPGRLPEHRGRVPPRRGAEHHLAHANDGGRARQVLSNPSAAHGDCARLRAARLRLAGNRLHALSFSPYFSCSLFFSSAFC